MASPALESFCCLIHKYQNGTIKYTNGAVFNNETLQAYNIICIISGVCGIVGSIYQVFPRKPRSLPQKRKTFLLYIRQNYLICLLSLADLCATFGLVLRSILWLTSVIPWRSYVPILTNSSEHHSLNLGYLSCSITSGWIHYFYICTYFWTLCYAVDVFLMLNDKPSHTKYYNIFCWGVSFIVTGAGLIPLYYPSLLECVYDIVHLLPHFMSAYIPILIVMIANPILYYKSVQSVKARIILRRGQYTDQERFIVTRIRGKFFVVILVFTVCWAPNIVNGVLYAFHHKISSDIFIALWMAMAVVNPLQGFLNCLIYRGAGGFNCQLKSIQQTIISRNDGFSSDEESPLLSFRR